MDYISNIDQKDWLLGLQYQTGPHTVSASYNRSKLEMGGYDGKVNKYAIAYTYNLSKRNSLYANIAYSDFDNSFMSNYYYGDRGLTEADNYSGALYNNDSVTGVQIGITHRF